MNNSINKIEIENSIKRIQELSENVRTSLLNTNNIIVESVNTNEGIWDGESASEFRNKWDLLAEDIPDYINVFSQQVENLKVFINSIENMENK